MNDHESRQPERWLRDASGSRAYGSAEVMQRRLASDCSVIERIVSGEIFDCDGIRLRHYAVSAWHWALALSEATSYETK